MEGKSLQGWALGQFLESQGKRKVKTANQIVRYVH